eukprot:GILI01031854.1.p1 GENE.GILI01031854.1~~GILI01031854.1.p1  ORF type:complete len:267 (-),score=64.43 GILI01031854.1:25-825(-)
MRQGAFNALKDMLDENGSNIDIHRVNDNQTYEKSSKEDMLSQTERTAKMSEVALELKNKSASEKKEWGLRKKDQGNKLYREKKFQEAADIYLQALMSMDVEASAEEKNVYQQEVQIPCLNNIAACMTEMSEWAKCVSICQQALLIDPRSFKSLFRRGQAMFNLGRFEEAKKDLQGALANLPADQTAVRDKITLLLHKIKAQEKKDKAVYANMFSKGNLYDDKEFTPPEEEEEFVFGAESPSWWSRLTSRCCRRKAVKQETFLLKQE